MVVGYLCVKVTSLILLSASGWQVLCLCFPSVHLCLCVIMVYIRSCTFWPGWGQPFSHHLRLCIWAMLMNKFSAVETILYSSLRILYQALLKLQGQKDKSKKFQGIFRINCEISCDSGCLSLAMEVQTVPVNFTFLYLPGTALGQGNLTVESYSITKSHGKHISR